MDSGSININDSDGISEEPSLLKLNDDCLFEIFQLLQFSDYVNLAETCKRLRAISDTVHKFEKIEIVANRSMEKGKISEEKLSRILSLIGAQLSSIKIWFGNDDFLERVRKNCKNIDSLELLYFEKPPQLQGFSNLKELSIKWGARIENCEFGKLFASNPGIENVIYDHVDEDFIQLLHLLPNLKSLGVGWPCNSTAPTKNEIYLTNLTKLSFVRGRFFNGFLIVLQTELSVVELEFDISISDYTFERVKLFLNLEVLSVVHRYSLYNLPEEITFPPKIKRIKRFYNISLSYTTLISIIKQLKCLEEFDLSGAYLWYRDPDEDTSLYRSTISRVVAELKAEFNQRNLKIIFPQKNENDEPCLYSSENLNIIRRDYWKQCESKKPVLEVFHDVRYDDNLS